MKLYTADEMSRADASAQEPGIPGGVLMERAGAAIARVILKRFAPERALVVCGGGNNGGDGFVIARELHNAGVGVAVFATKDEYSGDPKTNLEVLKNLGIRFVREDELIGGLVASDLIVDALLGTGFSGEVREREAGFMDGINASGATVVSVDVPSGVNGSTGEVVGKAVGADLTVCAHAAKVGCFVAPGRDFAGEIAVVEIGIPEEADVEPSVTLTDAASLRGAIPRLSGEVHKYSAGAVFVVAGSRAMTGAAVMVTEGAQRAGCGIVFVAVPESTASTIDLRLIEALVYGVSEDEEGHTSDDALEEILSLAGRASAVVAGPGLGVGERQTKLLEGLLREVEVPLLLDADALTNLAGTDLIAKRPHPTVLTPHAGELGRLLDVGAGEISGHRLRSSREAASRNDCCVLLKGPDTIVVEGERTAINTTGSVALATAGTGDVLSGVIGALLSRGMEPFEAARAGAWAHGRAAELWLEEIGWPAESLVATDLIRYVPKAVAEIA